MSAIRFVRILLLSFVALLLISVRVSFAQDPPIEWKDIPQADLEMKICPLDTAAKAMLLAEYGVATISSDMGIEFTHHSRIKIFSEAGYAWGSRSMTLYTDDGYQTLDDIEGATYTLDEKGEAVRTKLDKGSIFKEKVDEHRTGYRFAFPGLKPGCIIEYRYTIRYKHAFHFPEWTFQSSIPVRWSEYRVTIPNAMAYVRSTKGFERLAVNESKDVTMRFSGRAASYLGDQIAHCTMYRWVMRDVPAIEEEPFITTMKDYASSVELQLAAYAIPGGGSKQVLQSWDELVKDLVESDELGKMAEKTGAVEDLVKTITAGKTDQKQKMIALYDYVRSTFVQTGDDALFAEESMKDILTSKRGNSASINLVLTAMLRSAGIEANPVALSTRGHGKITELYPLYSQFDYLIVRANVGGTSILLDPSNRYRPYDLLPTMVLNVRGLVVQKNAVEWLTIATPKRYEHTGVADITVDTAGDIRGSLACIDREYAALNRRRQYRETKPAEIGRAMFDAEKTGLALDSVYVAGLDSSDGSVEIRTTATGSSYAQQAGEYLYVNPAVYDRYTDNPLKRETRKFPVDMSYPRTLIRKTTVHIPQGYEVKDLPRTIDYILGTRAATLSRIATVDGSTITVSWRTEFNATTFEPSVYPLLRKFYDQVVAADADQIVLHKIPPSAPKPAAAPPAKSGSRGKKK